MKTDPQSLVLLGACCAFLVYLLAKVLTPKLEGDERFHAALRRIEDAKRRARDRSASTEDRAAALREAAVTALEGLRRPELAASYARRAERLHPRGADTMGLLLAALRKSSKFRALERMLWRQLADLAAGTDGYERAYRELVALYEGPLARPEMAQVLRALRPTAAQR